jgi:hypothetical protein
MHLNRSYLGFAALLVILVLCTGPAAAAYRHNESIFTSSGSQFFAEGWEITNAAHNAQNFYFWMDPSDSTRVITPLTLPFRRDGLSPKVRYLYFYMTMPVGVHVVNLGVYNGGTMLFDNTVDWQGTGSPKLYTFDLGSYKSVNRGINTQISIQNPTISAQLVILRGAGAKLEW